MATTPAYPESMSTQIMVSGAWVDISAYRVGDVEMDWGIMGVMPADRMAKIGGMKLLLNNNDGLFTPNGSNAMTGFEKGAKIKFVITYGRQSYTRFKGKISKIGLPYKAGNISIVPIEVSDWFRSASKQRITAQGIEANITTAEATMALLEHMSLQPDALDIREGTEQIDAFFTNLQPKSTVYSELSNLSLTEFSYIYLRKDKQFGETLVVESRHSRVGVQVSQIPTPLNDLNWLTTENGVALLASENEVILADSMSEMQFQAMQEADIVYGETLINEISVRANPTRTDESLEVLFSLDEPIQISAGQNLLDFRVSYKNPTGGTERVNGTNMQTPAATTDYLLFANRDGTGANLTANLSVTVEYGSAGAIYRITNTGGASGWITKLQARGYPVYLENPIEYVITDQASIDTFELSPYEIDNKYQSNTSVSETIATSVLNQNKSNLVTIQRINLCANTNSYMMTAFLTLDIGDLIPVINSQYELESNRFIQSVKVKIKPGGVIWFEWGLVDGFLANETYWELEVVGRSELGETTYVAY